MRISQCRQCGTSFHPPSRHPSQKFCSVECRDAARTKSGERPCATCGTLVVRPRHRLLRLKNAFCSKDCEAVWRLKHAPRGKHHAQHVAPVALRCDSCGVQIEKHPSKVRGHNFCGVLCRETWQRTSGYMHGEKSATWRGGFDDYRGPNWRRQRLLALQRDGHQCQGCGSRSRLQVHHVRPWVTFDNHTDANDLSNLKTLCLRCHKTEEWTYWREHPEMLHLCPDTTRVHTCRKCGCSYVALSARSLDCDACCSPLSSRRFRAIQAGRRPVRVARR